MQPRASLSLKPESLNPKPNPIPNPSPSPSPNPSPSPKPNPGPSPSPNPKQVEFRATVSFAQSEAGRSLHRHELRLDSRPSNTCDIDGPGCLRRGTACPPPTLKP